MQRAHMAAGVLAVIVFLATGQLMLHHSPPMAALDEAARLMHRSRHIYILGAGLVNLMLGLYLRPRAAGWRTAAQRTGSLSVLIAAPLLIAAYAVEPARGFRPEMPWSSAGLYALFAGSMLHLLSGEGTAGRKFDAESR